MSDVWRGSSGEDRFLTGVRARSRAAPITLAIGTFAYLLMLVGALQAQPVGGRTLDIRVRDTAYDAVADRLYAAVKSDSPMFPNSIVAIDPNTIEIIGSAPLPATPYLLVLTDDGRRLFAVSAISGGPSTVYRVDAASMEIEAEFSPTYSDARPDSRIYGLLPLPGRTLGLAVSFQDLHGNSMGTASYEDERRLAKVLPSRPITSTLLVSPVPGILYGYDGRSTAFSVVRIQVSSDGLEFLGDPIYGMAFGFHQPLAVSGGLLYGGNGTVADVEAGSPAGRFYGSEVIFARAFAIDEPSDLIYFVSFSGTSIFAYHLRTFLPVSRLPVEGQAGVFSLPGLVGQKMQLTNRGDLVVFSERSRLVFIPTASIPRYRPYALPEVEQLNEHLRVLPAPVSYLAADPATERLYAVMQGFVPGTGNSVFALNPASGEVSTPLFAGSEPAAPAVSSGGDFLYVPLHGEEAVQRFRLPELVADGKIGLTRKSVHFRAYTSLQARQIVPLPGEEGSFAVVQTVGSLVGSAANASSESLVVYDGAERRTDAIDVGSNPLTSVVASPTGNLLFGSGPDGLSHIAVTPNGPVLDKAISAAQTGNKPSPYMPRSTFHCDGTLCATTIGEVLDPLSVTRKGQLQQPGLVILDEALGRIYQLVPNGRETRFIEWEVDLMRPLREAVLPITGFVSSFVRWSADGFAVVSSGEGIVLISTSAMAPREPPPEPMVTTLDGHRYTDLSVSAAVFDRHRNLVYASVPARISSVWEAYSNRVVALDAGNGRFVRAIPVGSDPGPMTVSDDGRYLYVGLTGRHAVARIDLDRWERDAVYATPGAPLSLEARPGVPKEFLALLGPGISGSAYPFEQGLWMYRDGQRLAEAALLGRRPSWALFADSDTAISSGSKIRVHAGGLRADPTVQRRSITEPAYALSGNRLFGGLGSIADAGTLDFLAEVNEYGPVVPDPERGRIYYLRRDGVRIYDWATLRVMGFLPFSGHDRTATMIACGPECLAVRTSAAIILLNFEAIQWEDPGSKRATHSEDGALRFPLTLTDMHYDSRRELLYVAVPAEEGSLGNSVVPIEPSTGRILDPMLVGPFPTVMTAVGDDSLLYVGARGSRTIEVIDLETQQAVRTIPVPQIRPRASVWAQGIAVFPGTNDVLAVSSAGETYYDALPADWHVTMIGSEGEILPKRVTGARGGHIFFSPSGRLLHGVDIRRFGYGGMWSLPVSSDGLSFQPQFARSPGRILAHCSGMVFGPDGSVRDSEDLVELAVVELPVSDPGTNGQLNEAVACDSEIDRLYYLRRVDGTLTLYDYRLSDRTPLASRTLPAHDGWVVHMESLGRHGVAYWISEFPDYAGPYVERLESDELVIVPGSGGVTTRGIEFSVANLGAESFRSVGTDPAVTAGYAVVETDAGATAPAGLAIFGLRQNGILVSEAGVPASAAALEGRIFAETDGALRTGIAMANPNDTAATVGFFFTDREGIDSGHGTLTLEPREQIAQFLDEAPFNGGAAVWGTFTFSSDLPVAVIALRGFVNERSEFLMTTLPVAPLAVPTTDTVYFPHFAAGGGWTTQVILVNPTHAPISGSVQFFGSGSETEAAAPATLTLADGRSGSTFSYAIPPRSAVRLRTADPSSPLQAGSVRAVADPGHPAPSGVSIFSYQNAGVTVSEAGVPAASSGAAFRVYVESSGTPGQPHSVRSGIALTNTSETAAVVSLELTALDGMATGLTASLTLPASGQAARFIDEFFPALTTPFSGILRIASTAPKIAAVGLRLTTNDRSDIVVTTTPPANENADTTASDLFFPHFVDSGGWTTQFILFSGTAGQTSSGLIRFTGQNGQPLELAVKPTTPPASP